jgi:type I restriction enzyme M protein
MRITVERPLKVKWVLNEATAAGVAKTKAWKSFSTSVDNVAAEDFFGMPGPFDFLLERVWDSAEEMRDVLFQVRPDLPADLVKEVLKAAAQSDPEGVLVTDKKGHPQPDADLRDNENVPLPAMPVTWEADVVDRLESAAYRVGVNEYVAAEVLPYVSDAWVDYDKTKIGYEIPLTRHFYKYVPPRPLAEIDTEIKQLEDEIQKLLREVAE